MRVTLPGHVGEGEGGGSEGGGDGGGEGGGGGGEGGEVGGDLREGRVAASEVDRGFSGSAESGTNVLPHARAVRRVRKARGMATVRRARGGPSRLSGQLRFLHRAEHLAGDVAKSGECANGLSRARGCWEGAQGGLGHGGEGAERAQRTRAGPASPHAGRRQRAWGGYREGKT